MSLKIADGTGSGYVAQVNERNRLETSATSFSKAHLVSLADAQSYIWTSSYSASTGDEIIYIKNTSKTKYLIINKIVVGCAATSVFSLYEVTGTAGGTTITGKNTNLASGNVADATSYGDASVTGLTIGDRIAILRVPANDSAQMGVDDVIVLGLNDAIAITVVSAGGVTEVEINGYYETVGDV